VILAAVCELANTVQCINVWRVVQRQSYFVRPRTEKKSKCQLFPGKVGPKKDHRSGLLIFKIPHSSENVTVLSCYVLRHPELISPFTRCEAGIPRPDPFGDTEIMVDLNSGHWREVVYGKTWYVVYLTCRVAGVAEKVTMASGVFATVRKRELVQNVVALNVSFPPVFSAVVH